MTTGLSAASKRTWRVRRAGSVHERANSTQRGQADQHHVVTGHAAVTALLVLGIRPIPPAPLWGFSVGPPAQTAMPVHGAERATARQRRNQQSAAVRL